MSVPVITFEISLDTTATPFSDVVASVDAAEAAAVAAAASAADAAADASAALAGVATEQAARISFDLVVCSAVSNISNAYSATATGLDALVAGKRVWITPSATNTGSATLALNGGAVRSIVDAKGQALTTGQFESTQVYELIYNGSNWRLAYAIRQKFYELTAASKLFVGTSTYAYLDASGLDDLRFSSKYGGVAAALAQFDNATGAFRAYYDVKIGATAGAAKSVFHPGNPPTYIDQNVQAKAVAETLTLSQTIERPADSDPVTVSTTKPYCVSAGNIGQHVIVTASGATVDMQKWTDGLSIKILTTAACTIYSGPDKTWIGQGVNRNMAVPANSIVTVTRSGSSMFYETAAAVTFNATAQAARDITIATIGQSLSVYLLEHGGLRGFQDKWAALGNNQSVWPVTAGLGASALLMLNDPVNYWWDSAASLPGPRATDAVTAINAAIALGQPAPSFLYWVQGEADRVGIMMGASTYTQYRNAQISLFTWLRTQLALPTLPIFLSPLGADDTAAVSQGAYIAIREAQVWCAANLTDCYVAIDKYDLPRKYTDVHLTYHGSRMMGERMAIDADNVLNAGSASTGPAISTFAGGTTTHVVTFAGTTQPIRPGAATDPGEPPVGFVLRSPGDPMAATYYTISEYAWSTNGGGNPVLTLTTTADATGCVLAYPGTSLQAIRNRRFVRELFDDQLPLRTWGG